MDNLECNYWANLLVNISTYISGDKLVGGEFWKKKRYLTKVNEYCCGQGQKPKYHICHRYLKYLLLIPQVISYV